MTTAKATFGLMEDAFACLAVSTPGDAIEITAYTRQAGIQTSDFHVSFYISEDKALELAKEIVERVKSRRKRRKDRYSDSSKTKEVGPACAACLNNTSPLGKCATTPYQHCRFCHDRRCAPKWTSYDQIRKSSAEGKADAR